MKNPKQKKKVGVGVGVMILKGDQILLGKRHSDPQKADSELRGEGTWTMPGGKLDFGERPEVAVAREVLEETGLQIRSKDLRMISVTNDQVADAHFITLGFLCQDFQGKPQIKEPEEIIEWQWFPLKQLPPNIYFPSRKILQNYFDQKIYKA